MRRTLPIVAILSIWASGLMLARSQENAPIAPETRAGEVWSVSVARDGRTLALARGFSGAGGAVVLWDLVANTKEVLAEEDKAVLAVAFSPDGTRLASGGFDNAVKVYDVATRQLLHRFTGHQAAVNSLAWSPDGKRVVSGALDTTVRTWDVEQGRAGQTLRGHPQWVLGVAFVPTKDEAVSSCKDGTLKVWDLAAGRDRLMLKGPGGAQCVAVSPDGTRIASGHWDHTVRLWDVADGKPLAVLKGHKAGVYSVGFSPDGATLASTSGNYGNPKRVGEIILWDVAAAKDRQTLGGHPGGIWCCCFTPDGRTLVTGGADQTVRVWEVGTGQERTTLTPPPPPEPTLAPAPEPGRSVWWLLALVPLLVGGLVLWRLLPRRLQTVQGVKGPMPAAGTATLEVQCPGCQKRLRVPAATAGKRVRCPGCAAAFVASGEDTARRG